MSLPASRSTVARIGPSAGESLLVLAGRLDELTSARARLALEVRASGTSPARCHFDAQRAVRDGIAAEVADACRRAAGAQSGLAAA
ncbi:hypothetical protein BH10ACT1_BH10ACT1_25090 [soil metagenome]